MSSDQLARDLAAMCGVWRDELRAFGPHGDELTHDDAGGVPGAFPYVNLVYVDFDGRDLRQTNVVLSGRPHHKRTFHATVEGGRLTFDVLGPDAPVHVGLSGGPGRIWFVAESMAALGVQQYAEPDLIRLDGDTRTRDTVLWRRGELARTLHVDGSRLSTDTSAVHPLDPRGAGHPVHGERSSTDAYRTATPGASS